jgi:hypothetical protein
MRKLFDGAWSLDEEVEQFEAMGVRHCLSH